MVDNVGVLTRADSAGDVVGMDPIFGVLVLGRRNNVVDKERSSMKAEWSVFFMSRGPGGEVIIEWSGWEGRIELARYWAVRSWR